MNAGMAATELAAELRRMRKLSGRSLKELESLTFVSDSSLSRYLSGRIRPPWAVVSALCRQVRRDPRELRPLWEQAWSVDVPASSPPQPARRDFLPRDLPDFTGRAAEVELLLDGAYGIDAVDGMAGVGKPAPGF